MFGGLARLTPGDDGRLHSPDHTPLPITAEPSCIYPTITASLLSLTFEDT